MMERKWLEAVSYNYYYNNLGMTWEKGAEARDTEEGELLGPGDQFYLGDLGKKQEEGIRNNS